MNFVTRPAWFGTRLAVRAFAHAAERERPRCRHVLRTVMALLGERWVIGWRRPFQYGCD